MFCNSSGNNTGIDKTREFRRYNRLVSNLQTYWQGLLTNIRESELHKIHSAVIHVLRIDAKPRERSISNNI